MRYNSLVSLIEQKVKHPAAIKQFQFFHRYRLAKAMYYDPKNDSIWLSLKILTNLRNHLSHDLEAAQLETKAKEFMDSVEGFDFVDPTSTNEERMRHAIVFMCGRLEGLRRNQQS